MANELTIYQSVIDDVKGIEIVNSCVHNLTWTHFRILLRVLDRNISPQLKQEIERQKAVFYMQHPLQIEEGDKDE